jgi:predicted transcriptional regulator
MLRFHQILRPTESFYAFLLLKTIRERKPESLKELEAATGRSSSNLSRTLKTMARYGIVKMEKVRRNIRPVVEATDFTVQFGLYANGHSEDVVGAARIGKNRVVSV